MVIPILRWMPSSAHSARIIMVSGYLYSTYLYSLHIYLYIIKTIMAEGA